MRAAAAARRVAAPLAAGLLVAAAATGVAGCGGGARAATAATRPPGHTGRATAPSRPVPHGHERYLRFYSPALGQWRRLELYLPPGYAAAAAHGRRFPVLYVLHAPPGNPAAMFGAMHAPGSIDRLIAAHRIRPMLIVVPFGKTPIDHSDTEWANAGAGRYMSFLLDAVRATDRHFATIADRQHRGIAGLSAGGYGAVNVALHHLDAFSVAESWSGYFTQTPTAAFAGASAAELRANSPTAYVASLAPEIHRLGLHAWLYQGLTEFIAPWRVSRFARQLHAAGGDVFFGWFPGDHGWRLWRGQLPRMLAAASDWFSQPDTQAARHPRLVQVGHPLPHAVWHRIVFSKRRRCGLHRPLAGLRIPAVCRPPAGGG